MPQSEEPTATRLLAELRHGASKLSQIDSPDHDAEPALISELCARFVVELERVVECMLALERLHVAPDELETEPDFSPETAVTSRRASPSMLGDVCFIGSLELTHAGRAIARATTFDDRLVAIEAAQRKLRRAITAVFEASRHDETSDGDLGLSERNTDLVAGLAVRRAYSIFRRSLRRPSEPSADALAMALRYAAFSLVSLFASPDFEKARVSDHKLLRHLHRRLLDWARGERLVEPGRELLEDVFTAADLLRGINRRQEVCVHDAALLQHLVSQAPEQLDVVRLEALFGLDDGLDALVERGRGSTAAEWSREVRERLRLLVATTV